MIAHGVGLCDEYPTLLYPIDKADAHDGPIEPGMTMCVESLMCSERDDEGIKLKVQVVVTEGAASGWTGSPWT